MLKTESVPGNIL